MSGWSSAMTHVGRLVIPADRRVEFVTHTIADIRRVRPPQLGVLGPTTASGTLGTGTLGIMDETFPTFGIAGRLLEEFTAAQLAGDRGRALDVAVQAIGAGASNLDVYVELIEPAQAALGRGWAQGTLTVADEHAATAITQHVVAALHDRAGMQTPLRGRLLVTGVEGENHEVGSRIIADALEADGWEVRYLGSDAPLDDVVAAVKAYRPAVVCVSVTMLVNVPAATALIERVRATDPQARVLVGGAAFSAWDDIWRSIGADARGGDVRHAMVTARCLQAEPATGQGSSM